MAIAQEQVIVKLSADMTKLKQQMKSAEGTVNKATESMASSIKRIVSVVAIATAVKKLVSLGDAWTDINSKLRLVTNSAEGLLVVQKELFRVAQDSRTDLDATVTLYSKLARSTKGLGISQKELASITETVNKAMIVSGASSVEAAAALNQLGQGLASGTLRGEELNSIMEQTPRLAEAIATGMGIAVGELRKYGSEGLISAETVINALKSQRQAVEDEFKTMPTTVGQAFTKLSNSALKAIGKIDQALGLTSGIAWAINRITETIESSKAAWNVYSSTLIAGATAMGLLFDAVGASIKSGFITAFNAVGIAFAEFQLTIVSGVFQIATSVNELRSILGKKQFDLSGIKSTFAEASFAVAKLSEEVTATGNAADVAWQKYETFNVKMEAYRLIAANAAIETAKVAENTKELGTALGGTVKQLSDGEKFWKSWGEASAAAYKKATDTASQAETILKSINSTIESGLTNAFRQSLDGVNDWGTTFRNILKDILTELYRVLIVKKLVAGITGGGGSGGAFAQGGAFTGGSQVTAYAKGGVVDQPTFFGMSGGKTGLMGEDGSEAIMPLDRMSDGSLGVKAAPVNINIVNNAGVNVTQERSGDDINIQLERIDSFIADGIRRNTSSTSQAIKSSR